MIELGLGQVVMMAVGAAVTAAAGMFVRRQMSLPRRVAALELGANDFVPKVGTRDEPGFQALLVRVTVLEEEKKARSGEVDRLLGISRALENLKATMEERTDGISRRLDTLEGDVREVLRLKTGAASGS